MALDDFAQRGRSVILWRLYARRIPRPCGSRRLLHRGERCPFRRCRRRCHDRRGAHDGQAERDIHALVEIEHLDRDERLIVVHADRRVISGARLGVEHGVCRKRSARIDPGLAQQGHGGGDRVAVLAAYAALLARVRV